MNLETNELNDLDFQELCRGNKCVAFFVYNRNFYWVLDWKENYQLNAEPDFEAYISKGTFSKEKVDQIRESFRSGISQLDEQNFPNYLNLPDTRILSSASMREIFFGKFVSRFEHIAKTMMEFISFGVELSPEQEELRVSVDALLPKFYINFDRKRYFHMDWSRFHDKYCYQGWVTNASDFELLIPHSEKYWLFDNGQTLWTVTNIRWD